MAKRKTRFRPLIRCGCPVMSHKDVGERGFQNCTCILVSPKTGSRGRTLAPRGKYVVLVTSHKNPLYMGVKAFGKSRRR